MLRLGRHRITHSRPLVMAIVNATPDSFFDRGATYQLGAALDRVDQVVAEGADIVDVGGVKAGPGAAVDVDEEVRRVVDLVEAIRQRHPTLVISVDTWRHEVGELVCLAGADLLNDAWGGHDPQLARVAARHDVALVCAHTGGLPPRTRPHRLSYHRDIVEVVREDLLAQAERALAAGVRRESILIDPAHDFGKNTWHSLAVTNRIGELVDTGWPVLVALSNKDFVGESLDEPVEGRLMGTLAASAVCAYQGVRIFRAHAVAQTRQVLDMVATIRGDRVPARVVRGLA